ncbi:hypothetical protein A3F19_01490 [Candidatus Nomurabacteria bacterium RIFCSPHIGHO2_12_FULL_37_29]|uniref:Uncharacterized protein n=2 Tax=Candidatus Nomuraibacteriota TaxID=1752729 RepID=A0A1F6Y647_9BACT|nr:MAG: hypothetical protein A2727_00095 [Candidatus Nomurabacteria bacterium RIFCSPHIGHO2_01_FULL_37_110]OGI79373.1 MAG: hypothetical protein A3F19_01490 [Candidatus Nomurabacteria bacterium RIFCSPHIGHO2_12_FULL_37_29]OGI84820.1 MAG: hypothetical protein A3A92_00595 [Candidatus Nomurabacteria bacterium RIFCSPLOWO2_01_FULL_37_49]OGJ01834.1 MAG: hypothetical protein A3G98_00735 [Candidatus Nomurabacteria bacterium RIFCSPLOWO2_12_FULL_37_8]
MHENIKYNLSTNPHKDAAQEVLTILHKIGDKGNKGAVDFVEDILIDLLNGVISPEEAIRRAKLTEKSLTNKSL